jgi:hypothetical protein
VARDAARDVLDIDEEGAEEVAAELDKSGIARWFPWGTGGGCVAFVLLVVGMLFLVALVVAWFLGREPKSSPAGTGDSSIGGGSSNDSPLVPIAGTWRVENLPFVAGCGPGALGAGFEGGTMEVLDGGESILASSSDPDAAPMEFERTEVSADSATYEATQKFPGPYETEPSLTITMVFDSPEHMEATISFDGAICMERPAQGDLVAASTPAPGGTDGPGDPEGDDPQGEPTGTTGPAARPPDDDGPAIDPSDLPAPGEARLEIGGQTFVFSGGAQCVVSQDSFVVTGIADDGDNVVDLAISGQRIGERWSVGIAATATVSRIVISSEGDAVDPPAIDGSILVLEATFSSRIGDDIANAKEIGPGRIVANCA